MENEQLKKVLQKISSEYEKVCFDDLVLQKKNFTNTIYAVREKYILRICTMKSNEKNFVEASKFCMRHQEILRTPQIFYSQLYENETGLYFTLIEKVKGNLVSEVWPLINEEQKINVIKQIAENMKILHQIDDPILSDTLLEASAWRKKFFDDITTKLQRLLEQDIVDNNFYMSITNFVKNNIESLNDVQFAICHSDLHFDNIMVNNRGEIVVLDFDRLRKASIDYELDVINRMCYKPDSVLHLNEYSEMDISKYIGINIMELIAQYYPQIFKFENMKNRLKIYGLKQYINILARIQTRTLQEEIIDFIYAK